MTQNSGLNDEDMVTGGPAGLTDPVATDADGTDGQDADGTDGHDADGTDGQDADGTDSQDADGTDGDAS